MKWLLKKVARIFVGVVVGSLIFAACWLLWTGWWRILWVPSAESIFGPRAQPGILALRDGLPVLVLEGTPEEMGRRHGEVMGPILRSTLGPYLSSLYDTAAKLEAAREVGRRLEPGIPDPYRRELRALAEAAQVDYAELVLANCSADTFIALHCSTFCASGEATGGGPLVFARNLDFPGFGILDGRSFVLVARPLGKRAFAGPAWPGLVGVQSGMNEKGVAIADMVDVANREVGLGVPHVFRMRAALEEADDVGAALALMKPMPAASTQNLMLCDEKRAVAIEVGPRRFAVRESERGLVFATNNFVSPLEGGPAGGAFTCPRYRRLQELTEESRGRIDAALARRIIASTSLDHLNLQSMVFVPAERLLLFGRGTTLARASDGPWSRVPLAPVLARGAGPEALAVTTLPPAADRPRRFDVSPAEFQMTETAR